jgi:hypothetical protein
MSKDTKKMTIAVVKNVVCGLKEREWCRTQDLNL